jgi:chromodomain-helicase-DNA-binding protein 1
MQLLILAPVSRAPASESDSDSDYGAPSKKKKKPRMSDEIRISTRGGKVPNYYDDVDDFETFEDDTHPGYYYADPAAPVQQEDEIELVLSHGRDEGRENDPEDNFYDNVVST